MRKSAIVFLILIGIGVGIYLFATKYDFQIGSLQFAFSKEKHALNKLTTAFLEDIRFKDFQKAATYHTKEDQQRVNIPQLIERLFKIKPEFVDIIRYEITGIDLDSGGTRARVKTHTTIKVLNTSELRENDVIFYWQKSDGQWYMKLESSLQ
jgi:hypothetical protein